MQENKDSVSGSNQDSNAGQTNTSAQSQAGDEALEGNTGAGGFAKPSADLSELVEGHDSDGNTGIMTNDDQEKDHELHSKYGEGKGNNFGVGQ
jgi:hypothetical protein